MIEAIDSIARLFYGNTLVDFIYKRTWDVFGLDILGFWICFFSACAIVTLTAILFFRNQHLRSITRP